MIETVGELRELLKAYPYDTAIRGTSELHWGYPQTLDNVKLMYYNEEEEEVYPYEMPEAIKIVAVRIGH